VTSVGLSAILTRSNSVVASITRQAAKVRIVIVRVAKFPDFQAEYEDSIPFASCKQFQRLRTEASDFILTTRLTTDLNSSGFSAWRNDAITTATDRTPSRAELWGSLDLPPMGLVKPHALNGNRWQSEVASPRNLPDCGAARPT
jgi:hypothetical protein